MRLLLSERNSCINLVHEIGRDRYKQFIHVQFPPNMLLNTELYACDDLTKSSGLLPKLREFPVSTAQAF